MSVFYGHERRQWEVAVTVTTLVKAKSLLQIDLPDDHRQG